MRYAPVLGRVEFMMASRQGVAARQVRQEIQVVRVELPDGKSGHVSASAVLPREVDAPEGIKPVQWRLLSNRYVSTLEQACELIDWYRARWEIELLHAQERLPRRGAAAGLVGQAAIALYLVVSWRIGYLMRLSRDDRTSEMPASQFFGPLECRLAYALHRKRPPARPKLREVVRLIAMLGGFIGRRGDGEPRVKTLWLGLHDLRRAVETAEILSEVGIPD